MSMIETTMATVGLAAYKPIRDAVVGGVKEIEGDLIQAGKTIGSGVAAVVGEVVSDVNKVKSVVGSIGRTIDTYV